jgi:hypothetical protein
VFYVDFVDSIDLIGVLVSRHDRRLVGKGSDGSKASLSNDSDLFHKAHLAIMK